MIKSRLKNFILKNCERGSILLYIGSDKYTRAFYLFGEKILHNKNVKSLNTWLRNLMKTNTSKAIELGKKIDKDYNLLNKLEYWETVGNIRYLMKSSFLMDNE